MKGIKIPKSSVPQKVIETYRKELTVTPRSQCDYGPPEKPFAVFRESVNNIYLPTFYGREFATKQAKEGFSEHTGDEVFLNFSGNLKDYQKAAATSVLDHINKNDSAILCVGCGFGKTFVGLWIAAQIGRKTLIVVHKEFLLQQWIQRIREFIPNARIGILQQNTMEVDNKDIVVAMLQSLTMRKNEYPAELFRTFGFSIFDECHHICSRTFSNALWKVATKKSLGLSATPHRKDGLTMVIEWFLGSILTFTNSSNGVAKPVVRTITAEYEIQPVVQYNFKGQVILPCLITEIASDPVRNMQIVEEIHKCLESNRKILVLSERRKQCETLFGLLGDIRVGLYLGGMNETELQSSNEKDVILATYSMAAEGYDCSTLDTLIMATSKSDVEQSIGRVLRKPNRNNPLIIDIVDNVLFSQAMRRKTYYRKCGFVMDVSDKNVSDKNVSGEDLKKYAFLE